MTRRTMADCSDFSDEARLEDLFWSNQLPRCAEQLDACFETVARTASAAGRASWENNRLVCKFLAAGHGQAPPPSHKAGAARRDAFGMIALGLQALLDQIQGGACARRGDCAS